MLLKSQIQQLRVDNDQPKSEKVLALAGVYIMAIRKNLSPSTFSEFLPYFLRIFFGGHTHKGLYKIVKQNKSSFPLFYSCFHSFFPFPYLVFPFSSFSFFRVLKCFFSKVFSCRRMTARIYIPGYLSICYCD